MKKNKDNKDKKKDDAILQDQESIVEQDKVKKESKAKKEPKEPKADKPLKEQKEPKEEKESKESKELKEAVYQKAVSAMYRFGQSYFSIQMKPFGLDKGQWGFLSELLFSGDGLSQEQLSEHLMIDKSNTARALKVLEEKGYITREEEAVTRKKYIYLTEAAKAIRHEIRSIQNEYNDILMDGFSDDDAKKARKVLEHMMENVMNYRAEAAADEKEEA